MSHAHLEMAGWVGRVPSGLLHCVCVSVCVYVWGMCMHIKVHMHVCTCLKAGSQCSTGSLAVIYQPCIDASRTRIKFYSSLRCVHVFGGKIFTRKALYS